MRSTFWQVAAGVAVGVLVSIVSAAIVVGPRIERLDANIAAISNRVAHLESGQTTPISAEARARLESIERRLDHLQNRIDTIWRSMGPGSSNGSVVPKALPLPVPNKGG